jgi:predicted transcriptional regulator
MKKSSYEITKEVIKFLKINSNSTLNKICVKTNLSYRVVRNSLNFLKDIGLVREKSGNYQNNKTRLFSLIQNKLTP